MYCEKKKKKILVKIVISFNLTKREQEMEGGVEKERKIKNEGGRGL